MPDGLELVIGPALSARIVTGVPGEGLITTDYRRTAQLNCPITSGEETPNSYFAVMDNPKADSLAATGAYRPWRNEDCTGTLSIDSTYLADDPTIAGPEPIVHTRGTRPLSTGDFDRCEMNWDVRHIPDAQNSPTDAYYRGTPPYKSW